MILDGLTQSIDGPATRRRIIAVAADLFYREGVRAVGVDRLIREADVAKATFYDHFPSKKDLVAAYLREWDRAWRAWLTRTVEMTKSPTDRLLGIFDALHDLFDDSDYRGCAFARAITDAGDDFEDVRGLAIEHKRLVAQYLQQLATEAGADRPAELTNQLLLLIDGAMVTAVRDQNARAAATAKNIAAAILPAYGLNPK